MTSRVPISRLRGAFATRFPASRFPAPIHRRAYATEGPNTEKPQSQSGAFYKSFGSPILKCFLGALFTYQVVYWTWMKLEAAEEKYDTEEEIRGLKEELKGLVTKKLEAEREAAEGKGKEVLREVLKEEKPKRGWW